ncbi:MAG: DUF1059 domain-containing protein [Actinomycetota bacterium]|nr:DUF1059 domain-containing protein [Actinomycetota bacterium]
MTVVHMVLRCDCGFQAEGDSEDDLVAAAQVHARDVHSSEIAAEVILGLLHRRPSRPAADGDPQNP